MNESVIQNEHEPFYPKNEHMSFFDEYKAINQEITEFLGFMFYMEFPQVLAWIGEMPIDQEIAAFLRITFYIAFPQILA